MTYFKHESAYVDEPSEIGEGTKIWHFCHIQKGARIGRNCIFGQNCNVANDVMIGNNVKVQNNVSIYKGTIIEDDVFLGPSCVLTNVTNPRSQVVGRSLNEGTLPRRGCSIGANAAVVCGITIGRYAYIGAGEVVANDVPDYALVLGVPARLVDLLRERDVAVLEQPRRKREPDPQGLLPPASSCRSRVCSLASSTLRSRLYFCWGSCSSTAGRRPSTFFSSSRFSCSRS